MTPEVAAEEFRIRKEDFPVETMRFLTDQISLIHIKIMRTACDLAAAEDPDSDVYRAEPKHVTQAIQQLGLEHLLTQ
ncbi:MAG: hypothetical protein AAB489_03590 [Patescibacteria group bacterium]